MFLVILFTSLSGSLVSRIPGAIQDKGRLAWQKAVGYGKRALVETMMGCWKTLTGTRLRARGFAAHKTEVAIGVAVMNRLLSAARPHSVRKQVRSA